MSDEKVVNKVTKGEVGVHKRTSLFSKNDLELEDDREVLLYVIKDLLLPKVKDLVGDILKGAIDKKLYGSSYRPREKERRSNGSSRYHVSYDRDSSRSRDTEYAKNVGYEDITFDERPDAANVLEGLCQLIEDYDQATIGDLYDLAGYTPDENFQKNENFGWKNLSSARVVRVHNYYMLDLPRARYLD